MMIQSDSLINLVKLVYGQKVQRWFRYKGLWCAQIKSWDIAA